jgi:tetratricopeptide (TPR) repeat protein
VHFLSYDRKIVMPPLDQIMQKDIELYKTALCIAETGNWKSAIALIYAAIALKPGKAAYHSLLAEAYLGCQALRIPVVEINPELDEDQRNLAIYTELARQAFQHALLLDPNDRRSNLYVSWLYGNGPDYNNPPPNDNPPPNNNPLHPNPTPKPPAPNSPMDSAAANFIDAEALTQVP